jgi:hypothetical protein
MPALVAGIQVLDNAMKEDADGRDFLVEDALRAFARP